MKNTSKLLSLLLALVLVLSLFSGTALATDGESAPAEEPAATSEEGGEVPTEGEGTEETPTEGEETAVAVESITLDKTTAELKVGETATLTATVLPENATDKTVTWESSDDTVATVENGVVTGVKAGTATITAKAGEQSVQCAVTVTEATEGYEVSYLSELFFGFGAANPFEMTPAFSADTTEYTVYVPDTAGALHIRPKLSDAAPEGSTVTLNYSNWSTGAEMTATPTIGELSSIMNFVRGGTSTNPKPLTVTVGVEGDQQVYTIQVIYKAAMTSFYVYDQNNTQIKFTPSYTSYYDDKNCSEFTAYIPRDTVLSFKNLKAYTYGNSLTFNGSTENTVTPVWGEDRTFAVVIETVSETMPTSKYPLRLVEKPSSLEVVTPMDKTEYEYGETVDLTGLTLKVVYADGTEVPVAVSDCTVNVNKMKPSDTAVTLSYQGLSVSVPVTVDGTVK